MLTFSSIFGSFLPSKSLLQAKPRFLNFSVPASTGALKFTFFLSKFHENSLQNRFRNALLTYIAYCCHFSSQNLDFETLLAPFLAQFWYHFCSVFSASFLYMFFSVFSRFWEPPGRVSSTSMDAIPPDHPPVKACALKIQLHSRLAKALSALSVILDSKNFSLFPCLGG